MVKFPTIEEKIFNNIYFFTKEILKVEFKTEELEAMTKDIIARYSEPQRYFHTLEHVESVLNKLNHLFIFEHETLNANERWSLNMVAIYHDAVYFPGNTDNEAESAKLFLKHFEKVPKGNFLINTIYEIILQTAKFEIPEDYLSNVFFKADTDVLNQNFIALIEYEKKIYKEFQKFGIVKYRMGRSEFLRKALNTHALNFENIDKLIQYVNTFKPRVGLYCGSFNPMTIAHNSIIKEAEKLFDVVIVAIGQNPAKKAGERITDGWVSKIPNFVIKYYGFTTDLIKEYESEYDVTLVRGLRNGFDLEYEVNLLKFMKAEKPDLKYVILFGDMSLSHISSSSVREIYNADPDRAKKYMV